MTGPRLSDAELERLYQEYQASKAAPVDPFKPTRAVNAAPRDASQTKATAKNVTGQRNDWIDAARTLGQGATMRFGDEIEAAVVSPFTKQTREEYLADIRGNLDTFHQKNPTTSNLLELSGGMLTGGMAAKALGAGRKAVSAWDAAKTAGQAGAAMGGAAGAGGGTNWQERATGGAIGAVAGGVLGGAAGAGAHKVAEMVARRAIPRSDRIIMDAMNSDQVTPTQVRAMLPNAPDEVSLVDFGGDAMRRLAGAATLNPSAGGAGLRNAIQKRSLKAGEDFGDLVESTTGTARENVNTAQAAMKAARGQTSGPLFEAAAQSGPVTDPRVADILRVSPEAQKAYGQMLTMAQRQKLAVPSLDDAIAGQPIDARAAHWLKLEMDGIRNAARKQAQRADVGGATTTTAGQITADAKALRDVLADAIPGYRDGLTTYAKASGEIKAYRAALKGAKNEGGVEALPAFTNAKSEDVQSFAKNLKPNERASYRAGAAQDVMRNTEDGTAAARKLTRVLDLDSEQQKFRTLFDDGAQGDAAFSRFLERAGFQRNARLADDEIIGNSKTGPRDAARQALQGESGVVEDAAQRGSIMQAVQGRVWKEVAKRRIGSASDGVSRGMTPQQKAQLDAMMKAYEDMLAGQAGKALSSRGLARTGAAAGSGVSTTRGRR